MRKFAFYISLLLFTFTASLVAADGGYRSPFAIGYGARQLGMGGAGVANVNGSSALFYNPAGLALTDRSELQLFHMTLFMDTRYDVAALAYPTLSLGTFGLAMSDLASGDFERIEGFVNQGTFSSHQALFMAGYGFPLFKGLYTGMTVKGVYYDIAGYKDSGFGFDFGIIYMTSFLKGLSVGFKATDIGGPSIKLNTIDQRYPYAIRGGLAYAKIIGEKHNLNLNVDFENTEKLGSEIYAGGEFGFSQLIFTRLGYMGDKLTVGAGLKLVGFSFDYAFASMTDLETSHRLSLCYTFGGSVKQKREARDQKIVEQRLNEYKDQEQQVRTDQLDQELVKARELKAQGKTYEAVQAYYRVLALDVQNEEAQSEVTTLFDNIRQDIVRDAGKGYNTQLIASQLSSADGYYDKKDYAKAAEQYNIVLSLDPINEHAIEKLAAINQNNQDEVARLRTQVQTYIANGNYNAAIDALTKILAIDPNDAQAKIGRDRLTNMIRSSDYLNQALKYFDQANYDKSIAYTDSALTLNPQSDGAISLKRQLNRFTANVTTLEDIKKNDNHWQIYLNGMEKYQAGDYKEAIKLWQSLLDYYPNNPNLKRNIEQAAERTSTQ